MAQELRKAGLEVTENVGGHGVIGVLKGSAPGPVILYRADMDALPISEKTGLSYASTKPGVMHACGHDLHMTTAVATLRALAAEKASWRGTVLFVGQPAEEVGSGAEAILADPQFQNILDQVGRPKLALAFHDDAVLYAGQAALTSGFITANVDSVDIIVHGIGGHGAAPHEAVDPVVIGSEIVTALQTIVSRRLAPGTKAVVTVGRFQGGTKRNIISSQAELQLTIRSYKHEVREQIVEEIRRLTKGIATAHGAPRDPEVIHHDKTYTPAGSNDPNWTARLQPLVANYLGEENLLDVPPSMVGEDFSEYSRRLGIPSIMLLIGASPRVDSPPGLHSDQFAPDAEPTLRTAANLMVICLLEALKSN